MSLQTRTFRCALITGASSGLGAEFCRQLASSCRTMILVARRGEVLEELSRELAAAHPELTMRLFSVDLADATTRQQFVKDLARLRECPDLLVNNAGMGDYGEFQQAGWEKTAAMIRLNVEALTHLAHHLLPGLKEQKGAVINVSSLASDLPIPDFAVYAATKAYVSSFSEALRLELREHGVPVVAVCPGPVKTGFGDVARRSPSSKLPVQEAFYVSKEKVVADSLMALERNRARVYPGMRIALASQLIRLLPRCMVRRVMAMRPRRSE